MRGKPSGMQGTGCAKVAQRKAPGRTVRQVQAQAVKQVQAMCATTNQPMGQRPGKSRKRAHRSQFEQAACSTLCVRHVSSLLPAWGSPDRPETSGHHAVGAQSTQASSRPAPEGRSALRHHDVEE
jgi:hypothetical protein